MVCAPERELSDEKKKNDNACERKMFVRCPFTLFHLVKLNDLNCQKL